MSVVELIKQANELLDMGVLMKHDESFVSMTVMKFDRGNTLDSREVSRLRDIVEANQ